MAESRPLAVSIGDLIDPSNFTHSVDVYGCDTEKLIEQLRMMMLIRYAEEQIGDWVTHGEARCPCHLGIGQEAVAVGVCSVLRSSDRVFGTHRSHSHYLATGGSVEALMAEVLGKVTGCSRGMGGSMHLISEETGFRGSVPIVGATIPLAVGAALAAKMDGNGDIAVAFFGDGAAEEGVLHESLNLAANYTLPVIFVCENNLFASHLHISLRQPAGSISRYATAHCIRSEMVDGNDIVMVEKAIRRTIDGIRSGQGPFFLEAVTYRWRGHVGPREDIDVGVKRNSDLKIWKRRDPIRRLAEALEACGALTASEYERLKAEVRQTIALAAQKAEQADYPDARHLLDDVYYSRAASND